VGGIPTGKATPGDAEQKDGALNNQKRDQKEDLANQGTHGGDLSGKGKDGQAKAEVDASSAANNLL